MVYRICSCYVYSRNIMPRPKITKVLLQQKTPHPGSTVTLQYQGQRLKWYHFVKNIFINSLRSSCNVFWSHSFPPFPVQLWKFSPISQEDKAVFRIPLYCTSQIWPILPKSAFALNESLSIICTTHIFLDIGSFTGAWMTYQRLHS